jgi:aryl-alcohol dehydrogenase-like predicted oxidoreductase
MSVYGMKRPESMPFGSTCSPQRRGLLTEAYGGPADFKGADFRTILPRFQPGALEHNLAAVDRLAAGGGEGLQRGERYPVWV